MGTTRTSWAVPAVVMVLICVPANGQATLPPSSLPPSSLPPSSLPPSSLPSTGPAPGPGAAGSAPIATFEGTIQSPPSYWDPYASPDATTTPLLPQDPNFQFGAPILPGPPVDPSFSFTTMRRFLDEVRFDYVWMAGDGVDGLGINDLELTATFAVPLLYNPDTPLLVTPGFAIHYWNGPESPAFDLPPRVYDAYLDAAWNPQLAPWLGGDFAFRVGVYSDFDHVSSDSVRFLGKGLMVLTLTPRFQVKAGAWYLDRNRVKILPAGGVVWTPNPDVRFEIFFPNPKLATRLSNFGCTEWWAYVRGEYGGGAWTVRRFAPGGPFDDSVDYNDLRVALGVEFMRPGGLTGLFEAGLAFEREILYRVPTPPPFFSPDPTVFLRAGLAY